MTGSDYYEHQIYPDSNTYGKDKGPHNLIKMNTLWYDE